MSDDHALAEQGPFVTRKEAAELYLRCHVTTIDRRAADGSLPRFKVGRRTLFRLSDVMKLVVASPVRPQQPGRRHSCGASRAAAPS